jgi:RNA polymerase sigma-54 factor
MQFHASQQMKLGQHMKLAPRMIQSMEILQMPLLQLEERIAQELESNVALEQVVPGDGEGTTEGAGSEAAAGGAGAAEAGDGEDGDRPLEVQEGGSGEDFERLEGFEEALPDAAENEFDDARPGARENGGELRSEGPGIRSTRLDGERDSKLDAMANTAARSASLQEQLREQWALSEVEESLAPLGELIISYIEDDGYLRTPVETIIDRVPATMARPTLEQMERALKAVQLLLDPPGVAARDLRECLLLQIDALEAEAPPSSPSAGRAGTPGARPDWSIIRRLVSDHLEDLSRNRLPKVAEKTGLSLDEIKKAMEQMHLLSIAPARALVSESAPMIIPDAIVEFDADRNRYIAYLDDSRLPNLRINREYAELAGNRATPKPTREFLRKNLTNASWLIDAVEQRRRTLQRVLNVVVEAQRDYFDYGPQALRPLPMTQVAEQLGVHVATVSRAVADKYLFTPRGVVPLRGFFTSGTHTDTGEEVSWDAVKAALKEVIDAEDKRNPLSDDALAEEVKKRGIEIARRTVAKYRSQLGVPSARLRRQF